MRKLGVVCAVIAFSSVLIAGRTVAATPVDRRCSLSPPPPRDGYDPRDLVKLADVVVRARADSTTPIPRPRVFGPQTFVHFTVLEVIDMGKLTLPTTLAFQGRLTSAANFNSGQMPYRWVRSDGMTGACSAYAYEQGGQFLMLLHGKSIDSLTPYWAPLQPTNEQVRGADDPWVQWVRAARGK